MKLKYLLVFIVIGIGLSFGAQNIKICGIRVSFPPDNNDATTGRGQFILSRDSVDMDILEPLPIDPPPHDRDYFQDHIKAVANYYQHASGGMVTIDTVNSKIYPESKNGSYQLDREMAYYHPFLEEDSVDIRLNELILDAVEIADEDIDYSDYDLVVVFHAGLGQIYNIDLDPTPKDIKSAYMGTEDFRKFLGPDYQSGISVDNGETFVTDAIILPETQNYILYDNWDEVFGELDNPADYQFGLNGTFALMMGFYLGLPSLSDTSGGSGVGQFGLMDQGSANLNSLVPAIPSAWERLYLGWEEPVVIEKNHPKLNLPHVELDQDSTLLQIPISNDEYFLIENRCNFLSKKNLNLDTLRNREYRANKDKYEDIYPSLLPYIKDNIGAKFSENGVLLSVPRYDLGLPGSGIMIWHIDEKIIKRHIDKNYVNISNREHGVDLEEGDGAQDLGYEGPLLGPNVEIGWAFDPWFANNEGFFELNPDYKSSQGDRVGFTPHTIPNTYNNYNAYSGIYIDSIGPANFTMNFRVHWDQEAGGNINFNLADDYNLKDALPVNLADTLDGLAVLGKELSIFEPGSNQSVIVDSDNTVNFNIYDDVTLLSNSAEQLLVAVGVSEQNIKIAAWRIGREGKITFLDSLENENLQLTSNPILVDQAVIVGVSDDNDNYIYKYELNNNAIELNVNSVPSQLIALAGNADNFYYLADGTIGKINTADLEYIELINDGDITGKNLLLGYTYHPDQPDLIYYGNETLGLIKDIGGENTLNTLAMKTITGVSLSDIDDDSRVEILVAQENEELSIYNSQLILENNFPVELGTELTGAPLSCNINKGGNEIFPLSVNGELYGINDRGQQVKNLPMATRIDRPYNSCLLNTNKGIAYISFSKQANALSGKIIGGDKVSSASWYCQGGDNSRSYMYKLSQWSFFNPASKPILNKEKTFCWPNPVKTNSTNIRYYLNKTGKVNINIYDLAGNFVESLEDQDPVEMDYNEIQWDVSNIESGVYFAVVKATDDSGNSGKEIIKIMVIK